jgi:hypothetical protein
VTVPSIEASIITNEKLQKLFGCWLVRQETRLQNKTTQELMEVGPFITRYSKSAFYTNYYNQKGAA